MATLFGGGMDEQAMQRQLINQRAAEFAQLNPSQRLAQMGYSAGASLGGGLAKAMGVDVTDPTIKRASMLRSLASKYDTTTPEGLLQLAQELRTVDPDMAMQVSKAAQEMKLATAKTGVEEQKIAKGVLDVKQETALRDELSALGPNPTQEAILAVVTKYGSPDKVLAALQASADRGATREAQAAQQKERLDAQKERDKERIEAQKQMAQDRIDAQIEAAKLAGATRKEIVQMQIDGRNQIAQMMAALKQSTQGNKPLPASLQKEEGADLVSIDTYSSQQAALAPAIASLTPNTAGVRKLNLGPVQNMKYIAQNAAGNSTPESRAYEGLKSAVDTAVNLQVSAEKGVQTDKDVLRFAQALVAAYGRNDSQATLEALKRYNDALAVAAEKTQNRLESRRKSQNVEPYGFKAKATLGTPENPIKLD